MKLYKNQSGFTVVEALLIIVVLAILGFSGWFVYHSKQATDKTLEDTGNSSVTPQKSTKTADTKNKADQYLVIPEWNVKLTLPTDGTQILYGRMSGTTDDTFVFTTKVGQSLGGYCGLDKDGLGAVTRQKTVDDSIASPPQPLNNGHPINGYYYYFAHPQAQCTDNDAQSNTNIAEVQKVSIAIQTLQQN